MVVGALIRAPFFNQLDHIYNDADLWDHLDDVQVDESLPTSAPHPLLNRKQATFKKRNTSL